MKIYYVVNARMPTDKAHGIQIAKTCDMFATLGVETELVVSSRGKGDVQSAYALAHGIVLHRIPVLDLQCLGPIGYRLTALQFICGSLFFLWMKTFTRERFVIYTVDMDAFSFAPLAWVPRPIIAEMHSIKKPHFLVSRFFKRAGIIATNDLIGTVLAETFHIPPERLCVEPNGVDASVMHGRITKEEARDLLSLPDEPFALYVGRMYQWKGLEILADVATDSQIPIVIVGGEREEFERVTGKSGKGLLFYGVRPLEEIPLWLAAADVFIVLGTEKNEESFRYTAPMKVFEYLGAGRPIVASRTPALESIIPEDIPFWYEPDDAGSLVRAIREAHTSPEAESKVQAGRVLAEKHTWHRRTERILAFMRSMNT